MSVLINTSVWIDYFRGGGQGQKVDFLIDENLAVTNELVLAELVPALTIQGKTKLINLLGFLPLNHIKIDWDEIRAVQTRCMKKGLHGVGIPDIVVAQNAIQYRSSLFSMDEHFSWLKETMPLKMFA